MFNFFSAVLKTLSPDEKSFFLLVNKFHAAACLVGFISGMYRSKTVFVLLCLIFLAYDCSIAWASFPISENREERAI